MLLSGCGKNQPNIKCSEGYTATHVPYLTQEPTYYCKINKKWADFKECTFQQECSETEDCISPNRSTETRCVPIKHYQMPCTCNINGGCACY